MKLDDILRILAEVIPVIALIWGIAEFKANVYKHIEICLRERDTSIGEIEKSFAIHRSIYEERREFVDYQINGLHELINHKFNRCMEEIKKNS